MARSIPAPARSGARSADSTTLADARQRPRSLGHRLHHGLHQEIVMTLEPTTQQFINGLSGPPPQQLGPRDAHNALTRLQSQPIPVQDALIEDTVWPVGPTGQTRIRIVRPAGTKITEVLPVILYAHGGGWVLGDKITHDRLVREIANGVGAAVVFVDYINAPEATYPTQQEQAYASLVYLTQNADALHVDASRLAIAGDSVGGHMAAVITLM